MPHDYKNTLNLPQTTFPMKANLPQREPVQLAAWQAMGLYEKIRNTHAGKKRFILHDGPPYANGHLHCGHALNKILKDIIIKSKSLNGFDTPYIPGWDCHGLPIELNVEKKLGKACATENPKAYRLACREYAESQIQIQRDEFQRLGVFGRWYTPYLTMNFSYEAQIIRALGKIIQQGHLYQGYKPVHWCIDCGSSLAEAEVDYEDKQSPSIDVAFFAVNSTDVLKKYHADVSEKPVIFPIWTTTPWTLPANEAVCLHQNLNYALIDTPQRYFVIAEALVPQVMTRYAVTNHSVSAVIKGAQLEGVLLKHPFYNHHVPVVLGEHVTIDSGTGCVHTAPAHGPDDYLIGKAYQLPLNNPVLANGCYAEDVELLAGKFVLKANEAIIDILKNNHVLLHYSTIAHSYPHCWRHKTPVIFRATPQWFITMDQGLRKALLQSIDTVQWMPEWGKVRMIKMMDNRPDWCVSRQRVWGTPIPLFIHQQTKALHPKTVDLIEKVAVAVEKQGIEAWFDSDIADWLPSSEVPDYLKLNDILDVWFDAGVSHYCVLIEYAKGDVMPKADLYLEGSDQFRGWFNSSLTTSVAMSGHPPYKGVLAHGFTVDAEGHKLSKSRGNYVELDKLIAQHGADVIRLWVSSTDFRNEVSLSDEIMKRIADGYRRVRNTTRFLLSNLFDFDPKLDHLPVSSWVELDQWVVQRAQLLQQEIIEAYENYYFHLVYQKIHNFCTVELGSFYLDIIKDRQYTTPVKSNARRSCQNAMYHLLQALTRWLAPILSYTAEEIWQVIPGQTLESVFLTEWYQAWPVELVKNSQAVSQRYSQLQWVRDEVNKALEVARNAGIIGSSLAAEISIEADNTSYAELAHLGDELRFLCITSRVTLVKSEKAIDNPCGVNVSVVASATAKCERCWHRQDSVGHDTAHPTLCSRCVTNLTMPGETRRFA